MNKKTLVLIKPTAVENNQIGQIINRFENAGFIINKLLKKQFIRLKFEDLYQEHKGKDFYEKIVDWMSSKPIVAMVLEGDDNIVSDVRNLVGATNPAEARPGTLRGDIGVSLEPDNIIHASDSDKSASREIKIFF